MSTYFAAIGSGLGDIIVCLPVLRWLLSNSQEPVYLVARSLRQLGFDELIYGLAGTVREPDLKELMSPSDRLINLRDHDLQRNWDWTKMEFTEKFPDAKIAEILTMICQDFKIYPDFSVFERFPFHPDQNTKNTVLLIPGTTSISKHLAIETWRELINKLKMHKISHAILGEPARSEAVRGLITDGVKHYPTPQVSDAINAISSASLVIAVDTGLMHVAVQQAVPTIAIIREPGLHFRPRTNCIPFFAENDSPQEGGSKTSFPATYDNWVWWEGETEPTRKPISSVNVDMLWSAVERCLSLV